MRERDDLRRARVSISTAFVLHAAVSGSWAPRVPALKAQAGIGDGELGIALFGMAAGLLAGTRCARAPVDRYGSRSVLRVGIPFLAAALLLPGLADGLLALGAGFLVLGFASGLLDVAMNAQGVDVERRLRRPILNGLHGLWSVGLGMGAALAAIAAAAHVPPLTNFALVAALITVISVPGLSGLLRHRLRSDAAHHRAADGASSRWSPAVLILGAIAFAAFVGEGSASDWSAVYLRDDVGAGAAIAATGFFAFAVAMAVSRFAGDRFAVALGPVRLVRLGALIAAAGLAIAVAVNVPALVVAGFAVFGAGIAPVVPTAISAAGRLGGPGSASVLGRVVTFGYLGSVLGPLAIGGLSQLTSVRAALLLPVLLALAIAGCANSVARAQDVDEP